ncbi:type II toxin-antitoxin system VapC family toxin [Haloarcula amylolytica]|uniref:Ribonuclease VapC n=2 Tax=Haloarcula TaxID=2237 RepID=M0JYG9_9EURY|nr:PIN domain-containing protein [Haloarcula amylolytica]EMA14207.1 PilT protein domain-containing protein [Haloarcula amylolytica JCM 13557]
MTYLLDTNILIAAVTQDSERSEAARELLNTTENLHVSVLNLMELRSVLSKKKQFERDRVDQIEARITSRTTVTFPDASDMLAANQLQSDTLLYPMDALVLTAADAIEGTLVSFDRELVEQGAVRPEEVLEESS